MSILSEKVKLSMLVNGGNLVDYYKKNSEYFYHKYQKSDKEVESINLRDIYPGGFYFLHYQDESNWLKYSPVFVCDFKKFSNNLILLAVNFNLIPLEIREMIFSKYITEQDITKNKFLVVDFEGMYNELLKIGFEYAIMEYSINRMVSIHRINLNVIERFLYHQHPINKYDPYKLYNIWEVKLKTKEERHREMVSSLLSEFYDINFDISNKYNILKEHIQRIRRNNRKFG